MELSGKLLKGAHSAGTHHLIPLFLLLPTWNVARKADWEGACRGHTETTEGW